VGHGPVSERSGASHPLRTEFGYALAASVLDVRCIEVRHVFSAAITAAVPYSIAVSKLRPVPSGTGLRRSFSPRSTFLYRRAPGQAAGATHRA
jgi:hypothetical protein